MDKQYRTYGDDRYDHLRSRVLRGFFSSSLLKEVFGSQKFSAHAKLLCVYICTSLIRHQGRQFLVGQFSPYLSPNNPHTHTKKLDLFVTFFFFFPFFLVFSTTKTTTTTTSPQISEGMPIMLLWYIRRAFFLVLFFEVVFTKLD